MNFDQNLKKYFLKPSELCFVKKPSLIRTVVGSCVTLTMYSKRTGAGAACHAVLPLCRQTDSCQGFSCINKCKYVECVVPEMIHRFKKIGVKPKELEIKLFGGAHMFGYSLDSKKKNHVGTMNIHMARHMIEELKVNLKSLDVGGKYGRKVIFNTATGDVWVKRFNKNDPKNLEERSALRPQIQMQLNGYVQENTRPHC